MRTVMLIAVVCAIALARDAASQPLDLLAIRVLFGLVGVSLSCFAARLIVIACSSNEVVSSSFLRRLQRLHAVLWLLTAIFLVFVVDWVTIVRTNFGLSNSILVDEILILAPMLFPWIVSWAIFYDLDSTAESASWQERLGFAWLHLQLILGIGIVPVLFICFVGDVAAIFYPEALQGRRSLFLFAGPMFLLMLVYPSILRRLWRTRPLPDSDLKHRLNAFAKTNGIAVRRLLVWDTEGRVANALVTGLIPRFRTILFSDRLLALLSKDEVEAAMAHELGHVAKRHLPLRLMALMLPLMLCSLSHSILAWAFTPELTHHVRESAGVLQGSVYEAKTTFGMVGMTLFYMWFGLGWYCRNLELEADLWACDRLRRNHGDAAHEKYLQALRTLVGGSTKQGWLHPSFARRRHFILRSAEDRSLSERFFMKMRLIAWAGVLLSVGGAVALICGP